MTDSPTPAEPDRVDPDVELASAHLDGEAGADERARVDDAAVQAHLASFARVSEQVRDVPPPPPGLLDDQLARAMEGFDADERVVPLDRRRAGAEPWWRRIPLGAVAAALVVVAFIGAVSLASSGDGDDDTATATFDTADESSGGASGTAGSDAAAGAMEESTALDSEERFDAVGGRLYDTYDALADDLRTELSPAPDQDEAAAEAPLAESDPGTTTSPGDRGDDGAGGDPCGAIDLLGLDPAAVVLVRGAVVSADEVTAVVHEAADGRRLTVIEDATCTVVFDRLL